MAYNYSDFNISLSLISLVFLLLITIFSFFPFISFKVLIPEEKIPFLNLAELAKLSFFETPIFLLFIFLISFFPPSFEKVSLKIFISLFSFFLAMTGFKSFFGLKFPRIRTINNISLFFLIFYL